MDATSLTSRVLKKLEPAIATAVGEVLADAERPEDAPWHIVVQEWSVYAGEPGEVFYGSKCGYPVMEGLQLDYSRAHESPIWYDAEAERLYIAGEDIPRIVGLAPGVKVTTNIQLFKDRSDPLGQRSVFAGTLPREAFADVLADRLNSVTSHWNAMMERARHAKAKAA